MSSFAWIAVAASAQSVPDGGFELQDGSWVDASEVCIDPLDGLPPFCDAYEALSFDASPARGAASGHLDAAYGYGYGFYWTSPRALSAPFVVTHDTLAWAQSAVSQADVRLPGFAVGPVVAGPASADAFTDKARDISAACGAVAQVQLSTGAFEAWFDDVSLSGGLCPAFVDGDADGYCPGGVDLDGDLDCADAGEIGAHPDCDDLDPAVGPCVVLAPPGWVAVGEVHPFEVSDATPGDTVWIFASDQLGITCPPELGGDCVDLGGAVTALGSAVVGVDGTAVVVSQVPAWPAFAPMLFQAAAGPSRSAVEAGWSVPANRWPLDPRAPNVFNGNFAQGALGWAPDSEGVTFDPYGYFHQACPAPVVVSDPARGDSALALGPTSDPFATLCSGPIHGWPFRVTRVGLQWATVGAADLRLYRIDDGSEVGLAPIGPVLAADGFDERGADVSSACGADVRLDLWHDQDPGAVIDGIHLAGPPCPMYVDADGDGRCPSGIDRDGDGACVSRGEQAHPPDDALPIARTLIDFEGPTSAAVVTAAEVAPIRVNGAAAGLVDPEAGYAVWDDARFELVTYDTVVMWVTNRGLGDWPTAMLSVGVAGVASPRVAVDRGPGRWSQVAVDVSGSCGETVGWIEVLADSDDWQFGTYTVYDNPDALLVDDLGFAGAPCPAFVDTDGNGLCAEGIDDDGDGLCVSAGEPTPGVVQDPGE